MPALNVSIPEIEAMTTILSAALAEG
jgi:hypothetical protein